MSAASDLSALAAQLRRSPGLAAKAGIASVVDRLGIAGDNKIAVGDDCAAIPDGDGYLLFAIEGFMNEFVAQDPWFAGWCGVMVNLSDIAAMGGRPIAVVDAIWSDGPEQANPVLEGLLAASQCYNVPIAGGHSNMATDRGQLSVAVIGRAKALLTSFDAEPDDCLIAAIDLRGQYRKPFANWQAVTNAPPSRLRHDLDLLPQIAEDGLCRSAKDISQGGIIGTAAMLAECSGVSISVDVTRVPKPAGVPIDRWLTSFPSFGFLLSVKPAQVMKVLRLFADREIDAAAIGDVHSGQTLTITDGSARETIWDFSKRPLIGCAMPERVA